MKELRRYGCAPFSVAVIHGGPGAAGELAAVAREIASSHGVLEPMQTAMTLEGQIEELKSVLEKSAAQPVTLIGYSYGAVLGLLTAAKYPNMVRKLLLVSSAVFEDGYAKEIMPERRRRLSAEDNIKLDALLNALDDPENPKGKNGVFAQIGRLLGKADAYDPMPDPAGEIEVRHDIHDGVWPVVAALRSSGELLARVKDVASPVTAIHGSWDPHPAEGVRKPLASVLTEFRFILLEKCGHTPWLEKQARDAFFEVLKVELEEP
jgi:pimeloyl-ACP methyl ester carboxylesterase